MVLLYFSVSLPRTAAPVIDLDDETFRYPSPTGRRHGCHRAVAAHGPGDRHHGRGRRAPRLKSEAALQRAMKAPFRSRSRSGCCSWRYRPSRPRSGSSSSRPRWPATSRERHFPNWSSCWSCCSRASARSRRGGQDTAAGRPNLRQPPRRRAHAAGCHRTDPPFLEGTDKGTSTRGWAGGVRPQDIEDRVSQDGGRLADGPSAMT